MIAAWNHRSGSKPQSLGQLLGKESVITRAQSERRRGLVLEQARSRVDELDRIRREPAKGGESTRSEDNLAQSSHDGLGAA